MPVFKSTAAIPPASVTVTEDSPRAASYSVLSITAYPTALISHVPASSVMEPVVFPLSRVSVLRAAPLINSSSILLNLDASISVGYIARPSLAVLTETITFPLPSA